MPILFSTLSQAECLSADRRNHNSREKALKINIRGGGGGRGGIVITVEDA